MTSNEVPASNRPLRCSACGAPGSASCDCNAPYVRAGDIAAVVLAANPDMSDRALADATGIGKDTIRRARKSGGAKAPSAKRTGKDGKKYPVGAAKPSASKKSDSPSNAKANPRFLLMDARNLLNDRLPHIPRNAWSSLAKEWCSMVHDIMAALRKQ
jgi:hypothetical protein